MSRNSQEVSKTTGWSDNTFMVAMPPLAADTEYAAPSSPDAADLNEPPDQSTFEVTAAHLPIPATPFTTMSLGQILEYMSDKTLNMIRRGFYNVSGKHISRAQINALQGGIHQRMNHLHLLQLPPLLQQALFELDRITDIVQEDVDGIVRHQLQNAMAGRKHSVDSTTIAGRRRSHVSAIQRLSSKEGPTIKRSSGDRNTVYGPASRALPLRQFANGGEGKQTTFIEESKHHWMRVKSPIRKTSKRKIEEHQGPLDKRYKVTKPVTRKNTRSRK